MPEVQPNRAPYPNAVVGWTGAIWHCLSVDATGQLQIDVVDAAGLQNALVSVGLDHIWVMADVAGVAVSVSTLAEQQAQTTALELIDNLYNALQSVATDRLIVRGEDQLFSFAGVLALEFDFTMTALQTYIQSTAVPAGEIWVVTTVTGLDGTRAVTRIWFTSDHDATLVEFHAEERAFGVGERAVWSGHTYLDGGDRIRASFLGSVVGDVLYLRITGYRMTVEV